MKRCLCLTLLLVAASLPGRAQDVEIDTTELLDLIESAQAWVEENLDTNLLNALPELDEQQVQQFFTNVQKNFQGEYVLDLAALKDTASVVLPLLQSHPETQPYAAWLGSRLDYFDVARELQPASPPKIEPGVPLKPEANPTAAVEREIWIKKLVQRPWPPAASNHVSRLKPVFAAQKVPPELVWIAEVESSFDPRAKSPVGAAGLFQLMPATAKRFDLSLWPRDQRYQPEPSARASASYLRFLYGKFKDWRLALAAYNAGEGTVQRLLDRYKTRSYDRIANHLPAETQMYVPKVEAVLLRREGMNLADLKMPRG